MKSIKLRAALCAGMVGVFGVVPSSIWAEPLTIIGFETDGGMAFEGATVSNYYTLEFAPTLAGPWTNWGSVSEQAFTGTVMSLPTPFFYRIRQTESSAFPPYAPASNIPGSMLADDAITSDKLADSAVDLGGPAVTGTVSDEHVSTNVALLNANQTFSGENVFEDKVGIGAPTPIYSLVVQKRSTSEPAIMIGGGYRFGPRFQTYGLDETPNAWMGLGTDMSGGAWEHSLYFPGDPAGSQTIGTYDGTSYSEKMRVTAGGRVGIGTATPTETLDVAGAVKIGTTANPVPAAGTIRWTGTEFEGFDGLGWVSLTTAPALPDIAFVPGGTFTMGWAGVATPEHPVTLSPFYLSKNEVTYALWYSIRQWATNNGYAFANVGQEGDDGVAGDGPTFSSAEPVTMINWRDTIVWCNAYSEREGLMPVYTYSGGILRDSRDANAAQCDNAVFNRDRNGYRLPTGAEWEYAARYGKASGWTPGDWLSGSSDGFTNAAACDAVAWYDANSGSHTHIAGTKKANQLGIFDMSGNAWEWCWDWYGAYDGGAVTNPPGPSGPATYRVQRGGSWDRKANYAQCALFRGDLPDNEDGNIGFRCARGR